MQASTSARVERCSQDVLGVWHSTVVAVGSFACVPSCAVPCYVHDDFVTSARSASPCFSTREGFGRW
eukprot:9874050-Lingulodinium_polyedra.AAC.1